jgi:hypothetical protein
MRRFVFTVVFIAGFSTLSFSNLRIDFSPGAGFYGDAVGGTAFISVTPSVSWWADIFGRRIQGVIVDNLYIGLGSHIDILPYDFSLYTISADFVFSYNIKIASLPVSIMPYITLGVPFNIFIASSGDGIVAPGFLTAIGGKAGYAITEKFEAGIGGEYRINVSQMFIGSIGAYLYCALII